jgi:hypothetical protein
MAGGDAPVIAAVLIRSSEQVEHVNRGYCDLRESGA